MASTGVEVVGRIGGAVDEVGAQARAAMLASRSLKAEAKLWGLDLAIRCCDLTSLEGADSPASVRQLAAKAMRPASADPSLPHLSLIHI